MWLHDEAIKHNNLNWTANFQKKNCKLVLFQTIFKKLMSWNIFVIFFFLMWQLTKHHLTLFLFFVFCCCYCYFAIIYSSYIFILFCCCDCICPQQYEKFVFKKRGGNNGLQKKKNLPQKQLKERERNRITLALVFVKLHMLPLWFGKKSVSENLFFVSLIQIIVEKKTPRKKT